LGLEVAGVVEEVGKEVSGFRPGERVMALLAGGGYAEEVTVPADLVLPLPERFSFPDGAAIPEVFITAHHNLVFLGGLFPGARVLIHAGASGVGTAAIQIAQDAAREIWVTVSSREKAAACEKLGARPILYKQESFADVIRERGANGAVDIILDPVGARYMDRNLRCLAPEGRLVLIGLMGGREASVDLARLLTHRLRIIGSVLRTLPASTKSAIVSRFRHDCLEALANREMSPIIDQIFPVREVAAAHERMECNANIGKIILTWS
jgi:putative PIG3 family NAD(P)H quinone oxidoreductase